MPSDCLQFKKARNLQAPPLRTKSHPAYCGVALSNTDPRGTPDRSLQQDQDQNKPKRGLGETETTQGAEEAPRPPRIHILRNWRARLPFTKGRE